MLNRRKIVPYLVIATASLLAGCQDQSYRTEVSSVTHSYPGGETGWPSWNGNGSGGTTGDTGGGSPVEFPRITTTFSLTGVNGTKPTYSTAQAGLELHTDNVLKVTVRAGQAGPLSLPGSETPFTANYGCVSYLITVGGRSVRTKPLLVNGQQNGICEGGVAEETIDFSDRLGPGSSPSVQVSEPRYDFYCQMWFSCQMYPNNYTTTCMYSFPYSYYNLYCPTRAVYQTHTVNGELEIQVNGT